jgi:hypothetical protein
MGSARTDFLTADATFLTGMATAVNLAGNFYGFNYSRSGQEADQKALRSDWQMVGNDIADSMAKADEDPKCLLTK